MPKRRQLSDLEGLDISEEEKADLGKAWAKEDEIVRSTFDMCREYLRMSPEELRHSGQKTNEGAIKSSIERACRDIEKLWKEHLKKWPDK